MLTVKKLESLNVTDHGIRLRHVRGIVGKVRAGVEGITVAFTTRFRHAGKTREVALGSWPSMSLKTIAGKADSLRQAARVSNPVEARQTARLKKKADSIEALNEQQNRLVQLSALEQRTTVRELLDRWVKRKLSHTRKDCGLSTVRSFEKDVLASIGHIAVADIKKHHIVSILDAMLERSVTRQTKMVLSDLRAMFNFAIDDAELIEVNPTGRISKASLGKDVERDRVLSETEVIDLFRKLPSSGLPETAALALKLQFATICRIGEIIGLQWANVDVDAMTLTIPMTKNGKAHTVYLSQFAVEILLDLYQITGATPWLFPSARLDGPINNKAFTKYVSDRQRIGKPLANRTQNTRALALTGGRWGSHDLRRTGASMMADELAVIPDVVERCLNHTIESKIKRIYQRAQYKTPMREAWRLLGERLELLEAKANKLIQNVSTLNRKSKNSGTETGNGGQPNP